MASNTQAAARPATDMAVAQTILRQLGGNRFKAMTGASSFSGGSDCLTFRLPGRSTKHRASGMRIVLEPSDTYRIELLKVTIKNGVEIVDQRSDVYAEDLRHVFYEMTGLHVSL